MQLERIGRHLVRTYLSIDPRSLGLFRILLGITLFVDLYQRYVDVDYWYTDESIVPTNVLRYGRISYLSSLFFHASTHEEAVLAMALCGVVYALFTLGCLTRLSHFLALVCVVSLNNRVFFLENGGHLLLNLLCVWSLFLPLGHRFSVDARLASFLARRRGRVPDATSTRNRPVVALAVLALLLQLAVVYLFNTVQKTDVTWKDGSAVYYVLHDERMNTPFAVWMREHVPYPMIRVLTWSTRIIEGAAVLLILSPFWPSRCRFVALALLPALHVGFALCLVLGIFSQAMISFFALLLTREHWDWLGRALGRRRRNAEPAFTPVRAPEPAPLPTTGVRFWLRRSSVTLREATVLLIMVASVGDLALNNPAWPERLRFRQPELMNAIISYPRIRQYWRMFAPGPQQVISGLSVEAWTSDGRMVDPYNEVASRIPALPPVDGENPMPVLLGQDQLFSDFTMRVSHKSHEWLLRPFSAWIINYPNRTGNPADRIERFQVYKVRARIPKPESDVRPPMNRQVLFAYP